MTLSLALGAIQVFDLDTKVKVASCSADFDILFWTWLNESTLAIVSSKFVYKWTYLQEPDSVQEVWYEKSDSLDGCQIINVQCDQTMRWCLLTGIQLKVDFLRKNVRNLMTSYRMEELRAQFSCTIKISNSARLLKDTLVVSSSLLLLQQISLTVFWPLRPVHHLKSRFKL